MSLSKLNIPKTITTGYNNRDGTYTGKLAYVIYHDEKGKLRKEKSWQSWKDDSIPSEKFDNEPTSGFVLNKKAGDYRGSWNGRMAWIRVYDPRGFEFEITLANLLFILQECSSLKGKGLEGDFVYAWDRADLVLLPTSSQEYKESFAFTGLKTKKITKADMQAGCVYRNKENERVLYLGRHDYADYAWNGDTFKKKHIFHYMDKKDQGNESYWVQAGFTKLAEKESDEVSSMFADEFDKFKKSKHGSFYSKVKKSKKKYSFSKGNKIGGYTLIGDKYYQLWVGQAYDTSTRTHLDDVFIVSPQIILTFDSKVVGQHTIQYDSNVQCISEIGTIVHRAHWGRYDSGELHVTKEKLESMSFYKFELVNEHGKVCKTI